MRRTVLVLATLILLFSTACTRSASKAEPTETLTFAQAVTKTALYKPTETPLPTFTPIPAATATSRPTNTPAPTVTPFALNDVNDAHPRWEDIKAVVEAGAMDLKENCAGAGLQGRLFCPNDFVYRGEMAMYVCNALYDLDELITIKAGTGTFRDIDPKEQPELVTCLEQLLRVKVVTGTNAYVPIYNPGRYLRTSDGWVFHLRGVHGGGWEPPPSTGIYFGCYSAVWYGSWCEAYINEGFYNKSLGRPAPEERLTRAEVSTIIKVFLENAETFQDK